MPTLPVFDSLPGTSMVRDPDSKRKRHSHHHGSHCWGRCCGAVDMRWLASGFVLGMLVFGGMSLFKGNDSGKGVDLVQQAEAARLQEQQAVTQAVDAAGMPEAAEDAPVEQGQPLPEQQADERTEGQVEDRGEAAQQAEQQQPEQEQPMEQQPEQGQPMEQQPQQEQPMEQQLQQDQPMEQHQQQQQQQPEPQAQQQQQQLEQAPEAEEQPEEQEQPQQAEDLPAMHKLHRYGIRYSEREPGTPAVGGEVMVPDGEWRQKGGRRVLIYLGADAGAELDYIINMDRDQHQKEYDLAFVFEPRPEHNEMWRAAVRERSSPVIEFWNKAVWTRDVVLDFGNDDKVGSVLRTKHNNFDNTDRTIQVNAIEFSAWVREFIRDNDKVTLVSDIQGAEFPVFSHLADTTLAGRIDTLYLECHYEAHANLIESISEDACKQLCQSLTPHVPNFYFWVGPNKQLNPPKIVRGFEFVDQPGLQPNDCDSLHVSPQQQ